MKRPALLISCVAAASLLLPGSPATCPSLAADPPPAGAPATKPEDTNAQDILRSFVQLQEQLHQAQLSIEQSRREAREAAVTAAETLGTQLKTIEAAMALQRTRQLEALEGSNRLMLVMAGIFAALGFAAMVLMAYFQWRTVHGLAEISTVLPGIRSLGPGSTVAALGPGEPAPGSAPAVESNMKLLGALEQLERRIHGLEQARRPALEAGEAGAKPIGNGNGDSGSGAEHPELTETAAASAEDPKGLLFQGQALMDQDDPQAALALFEKALAREPGHAEALLKKGTALERLGKLGEAVECYDLAIAADSSLTVAYLHKGGLFNRMEKFSEALECYEKALRTQESRAA